MLLLDLSTVGVVVLNFFVFLEESFDICIILILNVSSLSIEFLLDLLKLITVILSHVFKLLHHAVNQRFNINGHPLHGLHVVTILLIELLHKLTNQGFLILDNLQTTLSLNFDVLLKQINRIRLITSFFEIDKANLISNLPLPVLCSLLFPRVLASSNLFLHSFYVTQ